METGVWNHRAGMVATTNSVDDASQVSTAFAVNPDGTKFVQSI